MLKPESVMLMMPEKMDCWEIMMLEEEPQCAEYGLKDKQIDQNLHAA